MKTLGLFLLFAASLISGGNNTATTVDYDLTGKINIAKIEKGTIKVLVDEKSFIKAVNNSMLIGDTPVHTFKVLKGISIGEAEKEFSYMLLSSNEKNFNLVRALYNRNGKLVMDKGDYENNYLTYSCFVSCDGVDDCIPHMAYIDSKFTWGCSDKLVCVSPEEAKKNPCRKTETVMDAD